MPLGTIAAKLNASENAIISKLVQLDIYEEYQHLAYDKLVAELEKQARKLGRDYKLGEASKTDLIADAAYVKRIIQNHETKTVEFKQTFAKNLHTAQEDVKIKHAVVKTVAAFLNSLGGTLLIGVKDDKTITGIFDDNYRGADDYRQRISHTLRSAIGDAPMANVGISIIKATRSEEVCLIEVKRSKNPIYCLHKEFKSEKLFYVRINADTIALDIEQAIRYIAENFNENAD